MQTVNDLDKFARCVRINDRLTRARIGIGAKNHRSVAAQHLDKALECGKWLGRLRWRRGGGWLWLLSRGRWWRWSLAFGCPLFLFDHLFTQFAFGRKRAPVDDAKRFFVLRFGQGIFLSD